MNDPSVVLFFLALVLGGGLTGLAVHWLLGGCTTPPRAAELIN